MDSDASATSSLAPSTSDATRPYTDPLPSPIDQPARVMSFQESIQMNIESQQRELQAQIQLQGQQKLISQRREEQIKALSALQQDKVHAVFKLPALVAHCAAPTLVFAPSKTRFLTFSQNAAVMHALELNSAMSSNPTGESKKSTSKSRMFNAAYYCQILVCVLTSAGQKMPTSKEWRAIDIIANRFVPHLIQLPAQYCSRVVTWMVLPVPFGCATWCRTTLFLNTDGDLKTPSR